MMDKAASRHRDRGVDAGARSEMGEVGTGRYRWMTTYSVLMQRYPLRG